LLLTGSAQLTTPENWTLLSGHPLLFLSWAGFARFAEFMVLTPALTGGIILLLGRGAVPACLPFRRFSERCAATVALPALVLLPALLAFELNTRPLLSWSLPLFAFTLLLILLALAVALPLLQPLFGAEPARAGWIAASALLLFPLWVLQDVAAQSAVLSVYTLNTTPVYQSQPLTSRLATLQGKPAAEPQPKAEPVVDLKHGEQVYNSVCSACHEWDKRKVGPPYNDVVPKYQGNVAELKAFIQNPHRINPDYPTMPNLGLSERDINDVAHFLLRRGQK
jgi:cytochrome c551/c552